MSYDYLRFWYQVEYWERGILLTFGKPTKVLEPGLHWKVSFCEYIHIVDIKPDTLKTEPICITTLDGKTIIAGLVLNYEIKDVKKFFLENNESLSNLKDMAGGILSDHLEDIGWDDIKKKTTKNALLKKIDLYADSLGIKILDLQFNHKAETKAYSFFSDKKDQIIPPINA